MKAVAGSLGLDLSTLDVVEGSVASTQTTQYVPGEAFKAAVIASAATLGDCKDLASCETSVMVQFDGTLAVTNVNAKAKVVRLAGYGISSIAGRAV